MEEEHDDSSLLVVLLETHPAFWSQLHGNDLGLSGAQFVQQVLVFLNAFQLLNERNRIAVFGVHSQASPLLYASPALLALPGVAPTHVTAEGLAAALSLLAQQQPGDMAGELCLSAALSRALCFVNRVSPRQGGAAGAGTAAGGGGGDGGGGGGAQRDAPKPRVLVIQASPDVPMQYIAVMNAIFAAQRSRVVLDAAVVGGADSPLLQQGAYLTHGTYARVRRPAALLQYLLTLFAPDSCSRAFLARPDAPAVDFRASCFCHKRPMDIGYVCSVCLSIFCHTSPSCPTCGTTFTVTAKSGGKRSQQQQQQQAG